MARTYTVRRPGCTAWSGPGLTWSQACLALHEANDRGLNPRIYRDDSHADVTKWVGMGIEPRDGWDLCIYCGEPVDTGREQAAVHRACARDAASLTAETIEEEN